MRTARSREGPRETALAAGRLGDHLRRFGAPREAIPLLEEALHLSRRLADHPLEAVSLIRLATALQYDARHAEAEPIFREALELSRLPGLSRYAPFAWQHLGKCLAEQRRWSEAIDCFTKALERRIGDGDPDLIRSSREALDLAVALSKEVDTPPDGGQDWAR